VKEKIPEHLEQQLCEKCLLAALNCYTVSGMSLEPAAYNTVRVGNVIFLDKEGYIDAQDPGWVRTGAGNIQIGCKLRP